MKALKVFNPKMLEIAMEVRGMTQNTVSEELSISQGTISKIINYTLNGDIYAEKFAELLDFPIEFFYNNIIEFRSSAHYYRKGLSVSTKSLKRAEAIINILKFNIEKLLISVEVAERNFPTWDVDEYGSPTKYAQYLREYWRLPSGKINNIVNLLEDNGIIICQIDFGTEEIDALSLYTIDSNPIIFVNKQFSGDRQRLSIAHELGHLGMHFIKKVPEFREVEEEAWEFAREFMMPEIIISSQLKDGKINLEKLANLKRYWKISMKAILRRAENLNVLTKNQSRYLHAQLSRYSKKEPLELEIPVEKPTLIQELIDTHKFDLNYSEEELSKLLCISKRDFEKYFNVEKIRLRVVK